MVKIIKYNQYSPYRNINNKNIDGIYIYTRDGVDVIFYYKCYTRVINKKFYGIRILLDDEEKYYRDLNK